MANLRNVDSIIYARWIIPVIPHNKMFTDCALVIDNGNIIAIAPEKEVDERFSATHTHRLANHAVMPGLINAHGHTPMTLLRGYADDLPLQTWLEEHIWPAEGQFVDADFVQHGSKLAIAEMIRSGTTCFSDMYFFPEETASVAHNAGMRCQITFPVFEFPSNWGSGPDDYITKGLTLADHYRSHELINIGFGPHAPYTVSDETFKRIATLAPELQCAIHIHVHEIADEVARAVAEHGTRPLQRLHDLGVLTPQTQCVHMTQVNDEDIELLQSSGAHIIHCPESNLKLASGFCPVQTLMDADINVALGTDGCASNNNLDLFGEMHTAALLAKAVAGNAGALNAHQALQMATINGARALGIDDKVGSLEVGKAADITAIALDDIEQAPLYDLPSQLVYTHNGHRVSHVWVAGKLLMDNRNLLTLNTKDIAKTTYQWQQKLSSN